VITGSVWNFVRLKVFNKNSLVGKRRNKNVNILHSTKQVCFISFTVDTHLTNFDSVFTKVYTHFTKNNSHLSEHHNSLTNSIKSFTLLTMSKKLQTGLQFVGSEFGAGSVPVGCVRIRWSESTDASGGFRISSGRFVYISGSVDGGGRLTGLLTWPMAGGRLASLFTFSEAGGRPRWLPGSIFLAFCQWCQFSKIYLLLVWFQCKVIGSELYIVICF